MFCRAIRFSLLIFFTLTLGFRHYNFSENPAFCGRQGYNQTSFRLRSGGGGYRCTMSGRREGNGSVVRASPQAPVRAHVVDGERKSPFARTNRGLRETTAKETVICRARAW